MMCVGRSNLDEGIDTLWLGWRQSAFAWQRCYIDKPNGSRELSFVSIARRRSERRIPAILFIYLVSTRKQRFSDWVPRFRQVLMATWYQVSANYL
ncbi:hypothetical protein SCOR_22080 [Sulfidibacter corallicola]